MNRDLEVLEVVYSTVAPPDAPRDGAQQIATAIARLSAKRAKKLRFLLRMLRWGGFVRCDGDARARYLRAMSRSPIADLRTGYAALTRLALFIAYAGDDVGAPNRTWARIGYPGPRSDVPASVAARRATRRRF